MEQTLPAVEGPLERQVGRQGQHYGTQYSCGLCDSLGGGIYRVRSEPTLWWIGLAENGQAHYLCDDCKDALYNVRPVVM